MREGRYVVLADPAKFCIRCGRLFTVTRPEEFYELGTSGTQACIDMRECKARALSRGRGWPAEEITDDEPRKAGDDAWQPDPEVIDELQSKLDENWRQQEQQRKAGGDA